MPRSVKSAYTDKQKRMAEHIEESYEERGVSKDKAEARAWATVNKQTGGGRATKEGRKNADARLEDRERAEQAAHKNRSDAAKRGWETRRKHAHAA
jgi:hypothetical protein